MSSGRQCNIPQLDDGMSYIQVAAGVTHTVLLRSDGCAVACGRNPDQRCCIPPLAAGQSYIQVSAGNCHTVLLRSDGTAVACGGFVQGQCDIPPLDDGIFYTEVSAGYEHTVLLRSDGRAVACGKNREGQCQIPSCPSGIQYIRNEMLQPVDLVLQLEFVFEDGSFAMICSALTGQEVLRIDARPSDLAWEIHKRIANELNVNLQNLRVVLPKGQLLAAVPLATVLNLCENAKPGLINSWRHKFQAAHCLRGIAGLYNILYTIVWG